MATLPLGTEPVQLPLNLTQRPLLQNISEGGQRIIFSSTESDTDGCILEPGSFDSNLGRMRAGDVYEYPTDVVFSGGGVWVHADAEGAVLRWLVIG